MISMFSNKWLGAGMTLVLAASSSVSALQWLSTEQYGNGSNGALTISSSTTDSPTDSSCSGAVGTTTLNATNAGFAAGQMILIHQTRGTGAGNWEINAIQGYTAGTITTKYALANAYTDGGASQAQVLVLRQYSSVTVNTSQTWYCKAWDGNTGGILAFVCNGTTTINGSINLNTRGYRACPYTAGGGGRSYAGEGYADEWPLTGSPNGNGGGGGDNEDGGTQRAGGGGGGNGTAGNNGATNSGGSPGTGGSTGGTTQLTSLVLGGAGGNVRKFDNSVGNGGYGAAAVIIISKTFICAGSIVATGGNGTGTSSDGIGGGAGAGGSVLIKSDAATLGSGIITAYGGTGGGQGGGNGGGNGGWGRVAVHYGTSISGYSTPGSTNVQDNNLIPNLPPTAFSLSSPANTTNTSNNRIPFAWSASNDPEALPVSYTLKLSPLADFTEPVYRTIHGLDNASYTPAIGEEIADGTWYWKVIAFDGEKFTESSQTWTLTVATSPPTQPALTGVLTNLATGNIHRLIGQADSALGTALTVYQQPPGGSFSAVAGTIDWNGDTFVFAPTSEIPAGRAVYVTAGSTPVASSQHVFNYEDLKDIFEDAGVYHDAAPAVRAEGSTSTKFRIAVNGGSAVTVTAWLRKNGSYSGAAPGITLTGLGITGTGGATASLTAAANTWQQVTVTGTPNADGVLTLTFETFSTAAGSAAWIDDVSVSQ